MVMAYIIFVNPSILSFSGVPGLESSGLPFAATMAATCLTAGLLTIAMGLFANYPFAMAAGMGLNAVVAYQLVAGLKLSWPSAMGVIFVEGVIIAVLVLTRLREAIMEAIPLSLKRAISVGIGLFILFIGLINAGFVKAGAPGGPPVALGDLVGTPVLVAVVGLIVTLGLITLRVKGALLLGIFIATALAVLLNELQGRQAFTTPGVAVLPSSIVAPPDFSTIGQFDLGVFATIGVLSAVLIIFSIMLSDFFDTMGTVIGIGSEAGLLDEQGRLPRLRRVLFIDSLGAVFGGAASASSNTTYIESAAGVAEGGRTGLTSVVTGLLFLLALFFSPIAAIVPKEATAPALIIVGYLMATLVRHIPFDDFAEGFPALMTIVVMPFTYSITDGIGAGFISYTAIRIARGEGRKVSLLMYLATAAFVLYFGLPALRGALGI